MRLGIDFDNTIVCYDALFHRVAREDGTIPADLPANKSDVRNHLRSIGREDVWTEMQGRVYGARMAEADPYPGVRELFVRCRAAGIPVQIISHKTRHPYAGPPYDLHAAALDWLTRQGFFDPAGIGLRREDVHFELTKQAKLARIGTCGCTHFVDDLPEFLAEAAFPAGVTRILFDPNRLYGPAQGFPRLEAWDRATELLPMTASAAPAVALASVEDEGFRAEAGAFLARCGLNAEATLEPLPGGANNRVYLVDARGRRAVLKRYFHAAADPRDRFGAEHAFYTWAMRQGSERVPRPLGWDAERRLGLLEFVDGRKLTAGELESRHVDEAVALVTELNRGRSAAGPGDLPVASEACFSVAEHLERIGGRVERLVRFEPTTEMDRGAGEFVRGELAPRWAEVRARIEAVAGGRSAEVLSPEARCISPSDFGFHNALWSAEGRLRFLDFEYAGWDDPAKLVCDFFCQPQVPVPAGMWGAVVDRLDAALGSGGALAVRAGWLWPAYRVKWCCIMLNEFLGAGRARREFAQGGRSLEERKAAQLEKARAALAAV